MRISTRNGFDLVFTKDAFDILDANGSRIAHFPVGPTPWGGVYDFRESYFMAYREFRAHSRCFA